MQPPGPGLGPVPLAAIQCKECGFIHPIILDGKPCPMAKEKTKSGEEIDLSDFFKNLKFIVSSQIQQKQIKDIKKFLGLVIVEITKFFEKYKE